MFRYQWRAFWRRALRTERVKFYLSVVVLVVWSTAGALLNGLARAASDLAAGRTASMDTLLLTLSLAWLVVLSERLNVSLSNERLRRFPLTVRSLLTLRLSSLFLSPITWLATLVSVLGLAPLLSARHPVPGILAAVVFFALAIGIGVSVSQLLDVARRTKGIRVVVMALGAAVFAFALTVLQRDASPLRASLVAANPATLVTAVAMATTPSAMIVPVLVLFLSGTVVWSLLRWSFVRGLYNQATETTAQRATSIARLPGRLGPLVQKEQRRIVTVLDIWMGLLPVVFAVALSFSISLSSTVRQAIVVIVCALNINATLNCLGLDRPAGLTRYLILPIRGRDLLMAKNVSAMVIMTMQLALVLAIGAWQSGVMQLGGDVLVAIVVLLAHLAWGNLVSVFEPRRAEPRKFSSGGDPVTMVVSVFVGSAPGVAVIVLLGNGSPVSPLAIAAIVLLTIAAYYGSLQFAGRSFERRVALISRRLA